MSIKVNRAGLSYHTDPHKITMVHQRKHSIGVLPLKGLSQLAATKGGRLPEKCSLQ